MDDNRIYELLELLAEYLKKTDQAIGRIDLAYSVLLKHSDELLKHSGELLKHSDELLDLRKKSEKHEQEMLELRKESLKHEIQQEAILKEIFSISKRVQSVEEKK